MQVHGLTTSEFSVHSKDGSSSKSDVFERDVDEDIEQYAWRVCVET